MFWVSAIISTAIMINVLIVVFNGLIAWKAMVITFMLVVFIWFPWLMFTMVPFQGATREMLARLEAFNALKCGLPEGSEEPCPPSAETVTV